MKKFAIHESNIERLESKLQRIRNKCTKYGCDFHYARVDEEFRTIKDEAGTHVERYVIVECEGTAVVNGWTFAATLDHTETGNIIRKLKDLDVEIPQKYYTVGPVCEHCMSKRHRRATYIVYNEDSHEFKQVGSSCLCDFTNGFSSEAAAAYISLFDEMITGEAPAEGCRCDVWFDTEEILRYAYRYVKELGYVSTSSAYNSEEESTKAMVIAAYNYDNRPNFISYESKKQVEAHRATYNPDYAAPEVTQYISNLLEYINGLEDDSDYIHNLKVIAKSKYITYKHIGYAVSMVPCYNKYLGTERKKQEDAAKSARSAFVGEVGQRITVKVSEIEVITSWDTQFGTVLRFKFLDESGNVYMWDASCYVNLDGDIVSITGTIKKHDEFRGCKQTWMTRCKVAYAG